MLLSPTCRPIRVASRGREDSAPYDVKDKDEMAVYNSRSLLLHSLIQNQKKSLKRHLKSESSWKNTTQKRVSTAEGSLRTWDYY